MTDRRSFDVLESRTIHLGFHRLDEFTVRQRRLDGSWTKPLSREVYRHRPSAGILLHDPRVGSVALVEQLRLPAHLTGRGDRMIQIVAGMVDEDETPVEAAIREAREEAGLILLRPPRPVASVMTTPGAVTEICSLFYGEIDIATAGQAGGLAQEEEETRIVVMSVPDLVRALEQGLIFDGVTTLLGWWLQAQLLGGTIRPAE